MRFENGFGPARVTDMCVGVDVDVDVNLDVNLSVEAPDAQGSKD